MKLRETPLSLVTKNERKLPARLVAILIYPGVQILDMAGPAQAFTTANDEGAHPVYEVKVVAFQPGLIPTASGFSVIAEAFPERVEIDTLLVPGGPGIHSLRGEEAVLTKFKTISETAKRTCGVCTGAFLLASAGLLNERRAVTHWRYCEQLQKEFPSALIDPDPLFIHDKGVWTTAGVTAGIDLALQLIEQDHSPEMAAKVARRLVVYMKRHGGQKQYSEPLSLQTSSNAEYERLKAAITRAPHLQWTVERMAEEACQSPRTFHRRFQSSTGESPAEAVEKIRCDLAKALIQTTTVPMLQIAICTGFASESRLRRAISRTYGMSPQMLRTHVHPFHGTDLNSNETDQV